MLKIYDFSIDYVINPDIVRCRNMRFGWKLESDERDVLQKSYRIEIRNKHGVVFDGGEVESAEYFDILFPELVLASKSDYVVRVTVSDNRGNTAETEQNISTEILPEEWEAEWIKPAMHIEGWVPYLRTKFDVSEIERAVMYACGLGFADYYINGKRISDFLLDPPITNYEKQILYRRFDVTEFLREGKNALAVLLGEGFYSQSRVWDVEGLKYGDVCTKIRLEITLKNGDVKVITTNTSDWKYKYSPISVNNVYGGETYDARLETVDFASPEGSDEGWGSVTEDETAKGILEPCLMPPVRVIRELPAKNVYPVSGKWDGAWIFDLGENFAGVAEYKLPHSPKGAVYVFRYAENLDEKGHLDIRSTGSFATMCVQQDMYICKGDENGEVYRPRFTYHGFRYVELTGYYDIVYNGDYGKIPSLETVTGIQISTGMERTARFKTSYGELDKFDKLMHNTYISNYHGIPEDCPAREKCGWLGDAQVVCNYGLLGYDSTASYEKFLDDIRTTKEVYGTWQNIAPGKRCCGDAAPLWGCAQIIIPYYMYKYSGDKEAVIKNFGLMEEWIRYELNKSEDFIISDCFGDWCPPGGMKSKRRMPAAHSSTAIFYEICIRMEELCKAFDMGDSEYYRALAEKIKESFNRHFYSFSEHSYGYWATDGVALETGLYPDGERKLLLSALLDRIKRDDYAMCTGIYANKYLVPLLFKEGYGDEAFKFLFNPVHSGFATMMNDNATTIWESPDMKDTAPADKDVSSYNHPMHGGFMYFIFTHLCGIKPAEPGFSKIIFSPCFAERTGNTEAELKLISGKVSVKIEKAGNGYNCQINIPAGVTCVVDLPQEITVDGKAYKAGTVLGSGVHEIFAKLN